MTNHSRKSVKPLCVPIFLMLFAADWGLAHLSAVEPKSSRPHSFGQREHVVQRMNGESEPTSIPAEIQWISEPWFREKADENAQMPYLIFLPEKDRVLMLVETHHDPHHVHPQR